MPPSNNNATSGPTAAFQQQQPFVSPPNPTPVVAHKSAPPPPRPLASVVQSQKATVSAAAPIIRTTTVMTGAAMAPQQNIIINTQPTVLGGQQVIQAAPGGQQGVLQILSAAQPTTVVRTSATMTAAGQARQQPHLLPKPPVVHAKAGGVATSAPLILSQAPNIVTQQASAGAPLLLNSMGQIVGTAAQPQSPILIQQPSGNPLILVRPNVPTVQPAQTILPVVSQGQILLQQPATAATAITAQPQIKIITPQGRMQMQQIQTPSGPKLIAVPVGQTATLAPAATAALPVISSPGIQGKKVRAPGGQKGTLASNAKPLQAPIQIHQGPTVQLQAQPGLQGQIQLQGQLQLVGQPAGQGQLQLTTSQPSIQITGQTGQGPIQLTGQLSQGGQLQIAGQPVQGQLQLQQGNLQLAAQPGQIQLAGQPAGQGHIQVIQQPLQQQQLPQQPLQQQPNSAKGGTGDVLGDLMKDVGLDLDGFGLDDQPQPTTAEDIQLPVEPVPSAASGSQLVAQIQQPLPLQVPFH